MAKKTKESALINTIEVKPGLTASRLEIAAIFFKEDYYEVHYLQGIIAYIPYSAESTNALDVFETEALAAVDRPDRAASTPIIKI